MIYMKKVLSLIIIAFVTSCSKKDTIENLLDGLWSIRSNSIIYKNEDLTYCISSNIISFSDSECKLPIMDKDCGGSVDDSNLGNWSIYQNNNDWFLKIEGNNEIFDREFKVCFYKDSNNKLLFMVLESDDLYLECNKGLFNFNTIPDGIPYCLSSK